MTPMNVARDLIRQRGTTTGEPEFIAAYLAEEVRRNPLIVMDSWQRLAAGLQSAFQHVSVAAISATSAIRATSATNKGEQAHTAERIADGDRARQEQKGKALRGDES